MKHFKIRLAAGCVFLALLGTAYRSQSNAAVRMGTRVGAFSVLAKWRSDDRFSYMDSTGFPTHRMMTGITAWQQQVPLPQDFTGNNAFRIPRRPVLSDKPISAKTALFNGAIAIAVNGVPIFNPIKNDGRTDTFLAGELDDFGGHCGCSKRSFRSFSRTPATLRRRST